MKFMTEDKDLTEFIKDRQLAKLLEILDVLTTAK